LNKTFVFILAGFLGLFLLFSGCVSNNDTIKIGALYPLTGGLAQYGEVALKTTNLAIDEINANGGVNGRPIELILEDHQCDPKIGLQAFENSVDIKNVKLFSTLACTGVSSGISSKLEDKDVLMLATLVTGAQLSGISPNYFRNWAPDSKESVRFAEEIKKISVQKVGAIFEETDYAKGLVLNLEKELQLTNIIFVKEGFTSDAVDIKSQVITMQSEEVGILFLSPQTVTSGAKILKQMQDLNYKPNILYVNDNITKSSVLLTDYKDVLENAIGADYFISIGEKGQKILDKYKIKYGEECPQQNVCLGIYDSINLLVDAVKKAGEDSQKVRDYIKNNTYKGITGDIAFDEFNDRANTEYSLFLIKNGKAELVN